MVVYPFHGQTSRLTVWAYGKQNLTLGRTRGREWIPLTPPIRFSWFFFLKDETSAPDDFSG